MAQCLGRSETPVLSPVLGGVLQQQLGIWEMLEPLLHDVLLCICTMHLAGAWHRFCTFGLALGAGVMWNLSLKELIVGRLLLTLWESLGSLMPIT